MCAVATVAVLVAVAAPRLAQAQDAERRIEEGVALFNGGEFERSLQVLRRVEPSIGSPRLLGRLHLYVGLDYAFLGRGRQARAAFATALGHDPGLELDPQQFKEDVVRLFRQVRGGMQGILRVEADTAARVVVDGREIGAAPVTLRLTIGYHRVELRGEGDRRVATRVLIGNGRESRFRGRLGASAPPPPAASGVLVIRSTPPGAVVVVDGKRAGKAPLVLAVAPGTHEVVGRGAGREVVRSATVRDGQRVRVELELAATTGDGSAAPRRRIWTWVAAGAAVVFVAIGIGVWRWGAGEYDEYQTTTDPARIQQLADSIPPKYVSADVMIGLGGALAATAVVLYFLEGRHPATGPNPARAAGRRGSSGPSVRLHLLPGGASLGVRF